VVLMAISVKGEQTSAPPRARRPADTARPVRHQILTRLLV
jgi:hypothetical protein